MTDDSPDKGVPRSSSLTPLDEALLQFGKNKIIDATTTLNNFAKSMITIVSGFFLAYFALIKFLGLGENITNPEHYITILPPALFILSILSFVLAYAPILTAGIVDIQSRASLLYRIRIMTKMKAIPIIIGVATFLSGLVITLIVSVQFLPS
jgi:hypothetical protein